MIVLQFWPYRCQVTLKSDTSVYAVNGSPCHPEHWTFKSDQGIWLYITKASCRWLGVGRLYRRVGAHSSVTAFAFILLSECTLRKHAYSNILKILQPKTETFQIKTFDIFLISAQNIDCWYSIEPPQRGGSNEYPQSMFLSRNKKNNVYPCKPQFYYIKVGFKGVKII